MFLIPKPRRIDNRKGSFFLKCNTEIVLNNSCNFNNFETAKLLKREIEKVCGIEIKINKSFHKFNNSINLTKSQGAKEGYTLEITENKIDVCGNDDAGLFYGIETLCQIIKQQGVKLPCLYIEDGPYFKNRGFYHDVTRGKVPKLETLKKLVDKLAAYKINQLQLYIEHTFAFKNFSEVWAGKDPLTAEEILELDDYCSKRNVELVPSISTFGHLYEVLSTKSYSHLCELENSTEIPFTWIGRLDHHTLDVTNENSIKFVKNMLDEFIPLFSSEKFNICCDETFDLGQGKSAELSKKLGNGRLYVDFLKKIIDCVKNHNKQVMFWGDIILKHPEYLNEIPKDVICLNWNYSPNAVEENTRKIADCGIEQYVCPGVIGWSRIMNAMDKSFTNIYKMINYGKKYKASGVLNTDWGDCGHINLLGNSMPGMIYGAALSWNPCYERDFAEFDKELSVVEYGDKSQKIVKLLRELSNQDLDNWFYIVSCKENKILKDEYLFKVIKNFNDMDDSKLINGYNKSLEIEKELLNLGRDLYDECRVDFKEFIISAKGAALFNAVCLAVKKYKFKYDKVNTVLENNELAAELEYWFADYSKIWRTRNKESELYRIRETIAYICRFLRDN